MYYTGLSDLQRIERKNLAHRRAAFRLIGQWIGDRLRRIGIKRRPASLSTKTGEPHPDESG